MWCVVSTLLKTWSSARHLRGRTSNIRVMIKLGGNPHQMGVNIPVKMDWWTVPQCGQLIQSLDNGTCANNISLKCCFIRNIWQTLQQYDDLEMSSLEPKMVHMKIASFIGLSHGIHHFLGIDPIVTRTWWHIPITDPHEIPAFEQFSESQKCASQRPKDIPHRVVNAAPAMQISPDSRPLRTGTYMLNGC